MIMRLAIVSDIHGNLPALEAVVDDATRRGVDGVVNLGDCVSGPLLPLETAHYLMDRDWRHLAGNHERQLLTQPPEHHNASDACAFALLGARERDWLARLSPTAWLDVDVFACHGSPRSDHEYLLETVEPTGIRAASSREVQTRLGDVAAPLVLCGHTHVPRIFRDVAGSLIVNPGSVGLPAYEDVHPYPHAVNTGSPDARYAIVERNSGRWEATLLTVPYDHTRMVNLAAQRGRLDWARALSTGRVTG